MLDRIKVTVLPDGRLDRRNAAAFVGCRPQTMAAWAVNGHGPKHIRLSGKAYYALADLEAFVQGVQSEGQAA